MERVLLTAVLGFVGGIVLYSYGSLGWSGALFLFLLGGTLLLIHTRLQAGLLFMCGVLFMASALGAARVVLAPSELPATFVPLLDTAVALEGIVVADPDLREATQRVMIEIEQEGKQTTLLAVAPLYPSVRYGETVRITGTLERPEPFATDGGRTFAYDDFLAKDGVFAMVGDASLSKTKEREGVAHIVGSFSDLKNAGMNALSVALPEPHASLASGLILGGKQGLGEELMDDFIRTGLIHIVVLSGYNVMIVAEFVLRVFGFLSRSRAAWLAGATIIGFVFVAGAGAASVRAGVMAAIALYGRATGRTYDAFRALLFAGVLMVLWNPYSLAFDPGFQLSFLATLGLIFGAPLVEKRLSFIQSAFLKEIAAATIAAQIAVLPLLLYQNGLFSMVSLPANLLVLPMVPVAMLASAVAGLAGALLPAIAPVIALPAYGLLSYVIGVVEVASDLPLAAFSVPAFPNYIALAAYAAMGYALYRYTRLPTQVHASR